MLGKLLILLVAIAAVGAIAVMPAAAYEIEHHFCALEMAPDGTCPPNGSSEWAHLYLIEADAGGASHETCDDWYSSKGGYSAAECMYYAGQEATLKPHGEYGYPRAWNGGSVTHYVFATEYGEK